MMLFLTQPVWPATGESLKTLGVGRLKSSVKLPCFISGVGTMLWIVVDSRLLKRSKSPKKKVLSLIIGPPNVPPNWFCTKCPLGRGLPFIGLALLTQELASSAAFRRYSNRFPWYWFVPDLIVALITAPAELPNSVE